MHEEGDGKGGTKRNRLEGGRGGKGEEIGGHKDGNDTKRSAEKRERSREQT
jgi:hypothetical protein